MKRIILVLILLFLIGCHEETVTYVEKIIDEEVEEIEVIDYIEAKDLKSLVARSNEVSSVIDLEQLHNKIYDELNVHIDKEKSLKEQETLVEEIVNSVLDQWRREIVQDVVKKANEQVNEDDFEEIVSRTSIRNAYEVMLAYEMIVLRKELE